MKATTKTLLTSRRFLPLFITQFLEAFNDNVLKNSLMLLVTYSLGFSANHSKYYVLLASGLFILPFFLFSATAGQLADKYEKAMLTRFVKVIEVIAMQAAAIGFLTHNLTVLYITLFIMGTHSTFFGPIKFSILPEHVLEHELVLATALVESSTFVAILLGVIVTGMVMPLPTSPEIVSFIGLATAVAGLISAFYIPRSLPNQADLKVSWNIWRETKKIMHFAKESRSVFYSIIGISWLWLIGAMFLSQVPTFSKQVLGGDQHVTALLIATMAIGIALGSAICNKLQQGLINANYVPFAVIGMTIFLIDLHFAGQLALVKTQGGLRGIGSFLEYWNDWRVLIDMVMLWGFGGIFIVPLYAILQHDSEKAVRSRVIAANNVLNALFMVVAAVVVAILYALGVSVNGVFLLAGLANLCMLYFVIKILPQAIVKSFLKWLLQLLYRVEVKGIENYHQAGPRLVIIANHVSFIDAMLLSAFLPGKTLFAINTYVAQIWWMRPLVSWGDVFAVDPTNPISLKSLIKEIANDKHCIVFPEGRITVTGALMKVYEGPGMIADKANAKVLPIHIEGAQFTPFSRMRGKFRLRLFPKITLTILPAKQFHVPDGLRGRRRREWISLRLYDELCYLNYVSANVRQRLFPSLIEAARVHGKNTPVIEDINRHPLDYSELIRASFVLGHKIARHTRRQKRVGLLVPNSVGAVVSFFALHAYGKVPAMLNYSAGASLILSAVKTAKVKSVVTSKQFIDKAGLSDVITLLEGEGITFIYLEDIRAQLSLGDKLLGATYNLLPMLAYRYTARRVRGRHPAVILFTSGSEGAPKGVLLSHSNILANIGQVHSMIDFNRTDVVFNVLPIFHSFGLTGATITPLLSGVRVFFYPSPLHYRVIPELMYDANATILFGTNSFLKKYAKAAHPYDFYCLRYIFAGAEVITDETRHEWMDKFGKFIFAGYGTTETAPILSMNTPMHHKAGSVGRLLPAIEYRLETVDGVAQGGRLWVKGPNIMLGYYLADNPGALVPPQDGWYDTGDIVDIDEQGFVTILGRAKRFAKIGGEMVSLTAVEVAINQLWPDSINAVLAVADDTKGEQIICFTENTQASRAELVAHFKAQGLAEIYLPKRVEVKDDIPLLGSGKVDYVTLEKNT